MKPFYITTTLPYVNSDPHVGFAVELIRADVVARSKKLAGFDVFFNTGTDEHGLKIQRTAEELGLDPKKYVDGLAEKYKNLISSLGILPGINFIRTTDEHHIKAAQEFWRIVDKNGYIYKKRYQTKYCVGCELEKTDSELVDGHCPLHPNLEIELLDEENYFFKASAFQDRLNKFYSENPDFVIPSKRFNEIKALMSREFRDFSISRLASKMSWGIPVPDDAEHVMYVWFDALVDYISAIGWPDDAQKFDKWWKETGGVVQYCGKDNLRQQAAMWQAMLMAAGLTPSKTIVIDGFITGEGGAKMSKSLGNTIDPFEVVKEYGTDALRYFAARELHPFEDSPFSMDKFKEAYNAGLANGIGNLTSRILKMADTNSVWPKLDAAPVDFADNDKELAGFEINKYCDKVWERIMKTDKYIADIAPFKLIKENKAEGEKAIAHLVSELWTIAHLLTPVLPTTSETIAKLISDKKLPEQPLFMRK